MEYPLFSILMKTIAIFALLSATVLAIAGMRGLYGGKQEDNAEALRNLHRDIKRKEKVVGEESVFSEFLARKKR